MNQKQFTVEELHELEDLQIMGGKGPDSVDPLGQGGCHNDAPGCGAGVDQTGCKNYVTACGAKPDEWT